MHAPLTALDRCDRCGAQAYAVSQHTTLNGTVGHLYWCAHHLRQHPKVHADLVLDDTARLKEPVPA